VLGPLDPALDWIVAPALGDGKWGSRGPLGGISG
jgi:hypothetical protein